MMLGSVGCQADWFRATNVNMDFPRLEDTDVPDRSDVSHVSRKISSSEPANRSERKSARAQSPPFNAVDALNAGQLTLREALMIAFNNSDTVRATSGTSNVSQIVATPYDPMVFDEQFQAAAARFDPILSAEYIGSRINQPPDSFFGPGIPLNVRRDEGSFIASLRKPFPTGGSFTIGYSPPLAYLFDPNGSSGFNPAYTSMMYFEARQPLLKGAGIGVNTAPITIAKLREDQSALEVQQGMLAQVRSIEEAYWELQAAVAVLQAVDSILPVLDEAVRIETLRLEAELVTKAEVARVQVQRHQFRQQRVQVNTDVLNKQFKLGNLLGLSRYEQMSFIPTDAPLQAAPVFDMERSMAIALERRPDLIRQRLAVEIKDLDVMVAANAAQPQVDILALYRTSGLKDRLDDSLDQMMQFRYTDYTLGVTYSVPLGLRAAKATRRANELQYAKELAVLKQTTENVGFQLAELARELTRSWMEYEIAVERVKESHEWYRISVVRFASPPPGGANPDWLVTMLNDYQQSLRAYIDAVTDASQLLAKYNGLRARFEEAQGTLLESRGIMTNQFFPAPNSSPAPLQVAPIGPYGSSYRSTVVSGPTESQTSAVPDRATTPAAGLTTRTRSGGI